MIVQRTVRRLKLAFFIKYGKSRFRELYRGYRNYVKKSHAKNENIVNDKQFRKIHFEIGRSIADGMLNDSGGVFIDGFGYFFVFKYPYRSKLPFRKGKRRQYLVGGENGHRISPVFMPVKSNKGLKFVGMDYSFRKALTRKIYKKYKGGFKYRSYVYSLSDKIKK
jgi:hypothetical protein